MIFEKGDIVILKSGGPAMTVLNVQRLDMTNTDSIYNYTCCWFWEGIYREQNFKPDALKKWIAA